MKEQIKELRVKIDGLAQLTKELKPCITFDISDIKYSDIRGKKHVKFDSLVSEKPCNSKEIGKAVDSLYLAKAWLGKLMGELGTENPYGSGYKTKEDIVPTQDRFKVPQLIQVRDNKTFSELNHIEKVYWLRTEIEEIITYIKSLYESKDRYADFFKVNCIGNVYTHLCEARFNLGFELERIKNE